MRRFFRAQYSAAAVSAAVVLFLPDDVTVAAVHTGILGAAPHFGGGGLREIKGRREGKEECMKEFREKCIERQSTGKGRKEGLEREYKAETVDRN